jgi:hypothetical protein
MSDPDDPKPDHSDTGGSDVGQGYPEEQPAGANPDATPDDRPADATEDPPAPETSSPGEGDPGQATGNPGAAG